MMDSVYMYLSTYCVPACHGQLSLGTECLNWGGSGGPSVASSISPVTSAAPGSPAILPSAHTYLPCS